MIANCLKGKAVVGIMQQRLHHPYGPGGKPSWTVKHDRGIGVSVVLIQFDTGFENKRAAVETVTPMMDDDGIWRVAGYFIR